MKRKPPDDRPRKQPTEDDLHDVVVLAAERIGYAVDDTRALCAHLLQNVNDHMLAGAIRALEVGDPELASAFIREEWQSQESPRFVDLSCDPKGAMEKAGKARKDLYQRLAAAFLRCRESKGQ